MTRRRRPNDLKAIERPSGLHEHLNPRGDAKVKYSEAEAIAAADVKQREKRSQTRPYQAYQCSHCGHWHIGKKPRGK